MKFYTILEPKKINKNGIVYPPPKPPKGASLVRNLFFCNRKIILHVFHVDFVP